MTSQSKSTGRLLLKFKISVPLEDLFYNQTNLKNVVTSHFLTEISWYPFNSVNPEEEAVFRHNKTVLNSWTVRRDLVWLR